MSTVVLVHVQHSAIHHPHQCAQPQFLHLPYPFRYSNLLALLLQLIIHDDLQNEVHFDQLFPCLNGFLRYCYIFNHFLQQFLYQGLLCVFLCRHQLKR